MTESIVFLAVSLLVLILIVSFVIKKINFEKDTVRDVTKANAKNYFYDKLLNLYGVENSRGVKKLPVELQKIFDEYNKL